MLNFLKPLIAPAIEKVCDFIPEPNKRKEAKEKLEQSILDSVNQCMKAQADINEIEAKHNSIFVAGWRPFIGWICGIALMWTYIVKPIADWIIVIGGVNIDTLPYLDMAALTPLIMGMLGMGGLRTYEKMKGVARNTKI